MNRRVAFPFLVLTEEAVQASPWMVALNDGEPAPAAEHLPDWDHACTIRAWREVRISPETAAGQLGIPADRLALDLAISVGTGQGLFPRVLRHEPPRRIVPGPETLRVELTVEGRDLSRVLDLRATVFLGERPTDSQPLAPRMRGARLWSDRERIRLEGEEPRFPIETASFSRMFGNAVEAQALWYLDWAPGEPRRDFHGSVRLFLNADHEAFVQRVMDEDPPTLQALLADVMIQITERTIVDKEAASLLGSCEEGTVGSHVRHWLSLAYPQASIDLVRSTIETQPGRFRAAMQSAAKMEESSS